jgi:hypothetical protein
MHRQSEGNARLTRSLGAKPLAPPVRPNPSIERTSKSSLRELSAAAHVERYGEPMSHAVRSLAGPWHA